MGSNLLLRTWHLQLRMQIHVQAEEKGPVWREKQPRVTFCTKSCQDPNINQDKKDWGSALPAVKYIDYEEWERRVMSEII